VNLPDGTTDDEYLAWLEKALLAGIEQIEPELLVYVAGADPYREDQLGGLALTIDGLRRRDGNGVSLRSRQQHPSYGHTRRGLCVAAGRHGEDSRQYRCGAKGIFKT
jgi:acetoin utilization deacetylase AcuC-like enzyme